MAEDIIDLGNNSGQKRDGSVFYDKIDGKWVPRTGPKNADATKTPPRGDRMSEINSSDFATTTKLPEWGSAFIKDVSKTYANPIWQNYQDSITALGKAPAATEAARQASESQFLSGMKTDVGEQARSLSAVQAASGTKNSSVGTDQVSQFAQQVIADTMKQHETNVGAEAANYQNTVDAAAAAQAFSGMIGDYLGKTQETYAGEFAGLNLTPGNPQAVSDFYKQNTDGTGTWNQASGLQEGESYGKHSGRHGGNDYWHAPDAWTKIEEHKAEGSNETARSKHYTTYRFEGQTFDWNWLTGEISNVTEPQSLLAADMAGRGGLEGFAAEKVQEIIGKHGAQGMQRSLDKTSDLQNYSVDAAGNRLNARYGGLDNATISILSQALGTASAGGVSSGYRVQRAGAIERAQQLGRQAIGSQTEAWKAGMQQKQGVDAANANGALAGQIGAYLGLTRNTYKPDISSYLNYAQGSQRNNGD